MMEIDRLNNQIATMKKVSSSLLIHQIYFQAMMEKDLKIEQQRAEMTGLRAKNFEFRSKI